MTATSLPLQSGADSVAERTTLNTLERVVRYTIVKAITLFITVVVAVYLTILIANMGGFVDKVIAANIDMGLMGAVQAGWLSGVPAEEKAETIEQARWAMEEAAGLHEPFLLRTVRWLGQGLTLDWGESRSLGLTNVGGRLTAEVSQIILDRLPRTLFIFGTANLLLFFTSLALALSLSRKHGSLLDKIVIGVSPISAAPAWAYGIILNFLFVRFLHFSSGGAFDAWPTEFRFAYLPSMFKHLLLPLIAIFLAGFFYSVYAWRTFFLLYSSEDHVEMAKAQGLPSRMLQRRDILRPGLPMVLTSFALMLIGLWQEVIALEYFFNVAGIGQLFYIAIRRFDTPLILGLVVSFAYLLAITVFVLDILYAVVDPRVRVLGDGQTARPASRNRKRRFRLWPGRNPPRVPNHGWEFHSEVVYAHPGGAGRAFSGSARVWRQRMGSLGRTLTEIARYPSAVLGLSVIIALIFTSIATVIVLPYDEAISRWRGDDRVWYLNPLKAPPVWINYFRREKLPVSFALDSRSGAPSEAGVVSKKVEAVSEGMTDITFSFTFDYPYDGFPQDVTLYMEAQYDEKKPLMTLTWLTPDGREFDLGTSSLDSADAYHLAQDERLARKLGGGRPEQALFADPACCADPAETPAPLQGTYELRASALVFEEDADVDAELVLHGQVHGLAGTDHKRRDLMVGLLWGMPVALAFGFLAAIFTSITTMLIAAVGVWYGGWVDNLIQRVTEVNMILPFLPVSLMIYTLYSKSFWVILGVTVVLGIFGAGIKNYRAVFFQLKEAPYIEAAQAYGASNWRLIGRYLVPRIGAVLVPQLVILIPSYVFLEATLAFLGVSDPLLPTWGKLIVDALDHGTYSGDYHLVLLPASLLLLTGFAFAMVGMSLERIFEPRLREI